MHWLLFVLLIGADGSKESGWLPFEREQECKIKAAWYLQRLDLSDGKPAASWVVDCIPVASQQPAR